MALEDDEKVCPRCAETIKKAAVICRYCQYDSSHHRPFSLIPTVAGTANPTSKYEAVIKIVGAIFGIAIFAFVAASFGITVQKVVPSGGVSDTDTNAPPPMKASAVELGAAYAGNEVAAQATYGNRTLDVSGMVGKVSLDADNNPIVEFMIGDDLSVQAEFDSSYDGQLKDLVFGQMFTVECKSITSVASEPILKKCSIPVPDKPQPVAPPATDEPATPTVTGSIDTADIEYKQNQNHETTELSGLNDDPSCATGAPLFGVVAKRDFDSDGTTVRDFVTALPDGTQQSVGVSLSENLGELQRTVAIDGLQRLLKPGRAILGRVVFCGASGSVMMLDQIQ